MRRRVKHKYSSRTIGNKGPRKDCDGARNVSCSLPGEVTIATPIITQKARSYKTASEGVGDIIVQDEDRESAAYAAEGRKRRRLQNCPSRRCEGDPVPHDMRQKLRKVVAPARWMLIDGLYNGLDALLKGTEKSIRPQSCGARSLFSLCLRRVPDYIAAEQAWHESQDEDDGVDVCSEVYNLLENMSSTSKEGWKPLREVVRAHGVEMLSAAIRDGSIDHVVGRGLVFLCIHALAFDEAETLLDSLISSLDATSTPSSVYSKLFDSDATACLGTLDVFASRSGRHGFQYRQFEKILRLHIVPIEWVATTEFAPTWGRVIQSISHGDHDHSDATHLLITSVMLACGPADQSASSSTHKLRLSWHREPRLSIVGPSLPLVGRPTRTKNADTGLSSALNNTISSLMSIMYAISVTQRDQGQQERTFGAPDSNKPAFALLGSLNVDLLREMELRSSLSRNDSKPTIYMRRRVTVFLALLLLVQEWQGNQKSDPGISLTTIPDNIAALSNLGEINALEAASQVASVVSSIARCCAKACPGQEFDRLQQFTHHLASIAGDKIASTETRQLFACFALTTAMEYAQETQNTFHIEWALEVEESVMKDTRALAPTLAKTPHKGDRGAPQGYRWEDGICEWIAKTPKIESEDYNYGTSHELSDILSKARHQSSRQGHPKAPSVERRFGNSKTSLSTGCDDPVHAPPIRDSKRAVDNLAGPVNPRSVASQDAKTLGQTRRLWQESPKAGRGRSRRKVIPDAGPNSSGKTQTHSHDDELSTSDSLGEQVEWRGGNGKLAITGPGSTCQWSGRGSRQAPGRSKCPPLRFPHGPRQPNAASWSLDGESDDELGM